MSIPKTHYFTAIMEPKVATMHEEPLPEMGSDDVLLKMEACNICTTDYQQWMGLRNHQGFPMAGGHEWSGIVCAKGENVENVEIGDRVAPLFMGCGHCKACLMGKSFCCESKEGGWPVRDGFHGDRGFSDYKVFPKNKVLKMSKNIPAAEAGFLEPVATVVRGMKRLREKPGETVVVIGAGTMGLLNAQVAKAFGAHVIISELTPKKLERAAAMGFAEIVDAKNGDPVEQVKQLTDGKGADAVIAAVGHSVAYRQGMEMLKQLEGRFLLFAAGYPVPEFQINPNDVHYRRIEIIGTMSADVEDYVDAGFMISNKIVDCSYSLEGKTFALKDIQEAFAAAATPDTYRITVDLQGVK